MKEILDIKDFRFKDTSFASLMNKRIYNVLLIATKYDSFMLEDDGRIDEQIFNEYTSLNLRYPPRFMQVISEEEALAELAANHYDLIIQMPNMDDAELFITAKHLKALYPDIPYVVLTSFSREVSKRLETEDLSAIDYVFSWLGDSELLLAIIKLIEDAMNAEQDTESVGVQVILLVEDSVRFYSTALPVLYKIVMEESREFSKEALNEHEKMLRMRGRPKIMLARSYEEAVEICTRYEDNLLGVITDMSYMHDGVKDRLAGYELAKWLKTKDRFLPVVINSSETANKKYADDVDCVFIDKNSKTYSQDLKKEIRNNFGFGDFVIINPETNEQIFRIRNLKDLQKRIYDIPIDSLVYHMKHHHFARFFYSRAIFPIAALLKKIDISDFEDYEDARKVIYDSIIKYRRIKNTGVVAIFDKDRFDAYSNFARIGEGSIGGKGRSIAFMDNLVKEHVELGRFDDDLPIRIPRTVVLCTDIFDEFMEANDLYEIALSERTDDEILRYFLKGRLPETLIEDLFAFMDSVNGPIAVRSSSLLEDSHYQPFAGVYSTYMIPKTDDRYESLHMLSSAIKAVYASVFYQDSKVYMAATQNLIEQEKMAIVLQEVVGTTYGDRFYPTLSGVARSLNYYPIGHEKPEEGIASIVLGFGKYIVDGGTSLSFSPYHPASIMQLSSVEYALRDTQRLFYALDLTNKAERFSTDDAFNMLKLTIKDADKDGSLKLIASTYIPEDDTIYDGYYENGRKVISFASVLQHDSFPLAEILREVMRIGQEEMGRAVEIEFAVDLKSRTEGYFYLLQIRAIVQNREIMHEDLTSVDKDKLILSTNTALGHGVMNDIYDIVYVKTDNFDAINNINIVSEIDQLNRQFLDADKGYVLIGPGRWGSSDPYLGIPVKWSQISNARLLVEMTLDGYRIDPSQGTHFFQNLTSFGVGYFFINQHEEGGGYIDKTYLDNQPAVYESEYIRHIRFKSPAVTKINGKNTIGITLKPKENID
ncbi:PEP/pyruvate-binding domain-containing protein [Dysgonomonas sp. 25]|uniref:PEP/pyruvate-binding domain-containing protein n=1 Tax=Dysgonomonas sp. 25 TaxID=2302933 RepID=UPI0013D42E40|nr:PEP/pyruvate-binding domain-containing protein [Dysgonomonas sp. 25]NDV69678.1 phosphoenolpyruvate synthase [Dysgonomonas sp. 25]